MTPDKTKLIKGYLTVSIGCFILGIGIAICTQADLGADPLTVFLTGIYWRMTVSLGMSNLIISFAMIAAGWILCRKNITLVTFLGMIAASFGIDFMNWICPLAPVLPWNVLWFLAGVAVYTFGIAVTQIPQCGYSAYDTLVFGIIEKTHWSYHTVRWITDLSFLALGVILGGTAGVGTILLLLMTGKLAEFFVSLLKKQIHE